ncbi:MAG: hypothetical protein RSB96_03670 [Oscillospiraceae bacterium]
MNFILYGIKIKMTYTFFLVMVLFLAFDKLGLSVLVLSSILLHELGHIIMMYLFGQKINRISFDFYGINISKTQINLSFIRELIVASSGIIMNGIILFISIFVLKNVHLSYINLCIILFNLLPIGRLDGGQILDKVLQLLFNHTVAYAIYRFISNMVFIIITLFSFLLVAIDLRYIFLTITLFYLGYFIIND